MIDKQKLYILGEFYFKKGNLEKAKEIFTNLVQISPETFPYCYLLGKIEYNLKNFNSAIEHLEKTRSLNPFHKQTLLLLSKAYLENSNYAQALECMVDSYLVCKETKDERIDIYKKKIRTLAKKLPGMDDQQKSKLIKDRLQILNQHLQNLEKTQINDSQEDSLETIPEIQTQELHVEMVDYMSDSPAINPGQNEPDTSIDIPGIEDPVSDHDHEDEVVDEKPETSNNLIKPDFNSPSAREIDFTKHVLFKSLSVQEIEKISQFSTLYTYEKGETIYHSMEPIYGFNCVMEGKVEILYRDKQLLELENGSIIDEAELCNGSKYFFDCRALETTKVLMINKAALLTLCKRKHELAVHFLWHFYKSLSLKISAIMEMILLENPSQDMIWSLDSAKEISQQRGMNELEIDFLTRKCTKIIKHKNDYLFKNQDATNFFYILLEGEIELENPYAKDRLTIQSGEVFSEIALISNSFEHAMDAKIISDHAILLQMNRQGLSSLQDPSNRDNYRMMEFLWNIFSKKYFEFLNLYYHLLKA